MLLLSSFDLTFGILQDFIRIRVKVAMRKEFRSEWRDKVARLNLGFKVTAPALFQQNTRI